MTETLLITVHTRDESHTCAFDASTQSMLPLGTSPCPPVERALARIETREEGLALEAARGARIVALGSGDVEVTSLQIPEEGGVFLVRRDRDAITLHVRPSTRGVRTFATRCVGDAEFLIGRERDCGVRYRSRLVSAHHARVVVKDGSFAVTDLKSANGTFVNGARLSAHQPRRLAPGDVVQVLDLTFCVGDGLLCVNAPEHVSADGIMRVSRQPHEARASVPVSADATHAPFFPAPRLSGSIHPLRLAVDDPPPRRDEGRQPAILQLGPSFLMGLTSMFMAATSIARLAGGADVLTTAPSLAMAVAMVGGSAVWPVVSRSYTRKLKRREEALRTQAYVAYLDGVENELAAEKSRQERVIRENRLEIDELVERARAHPPLLMNRTSVHDDFLELRVGTGTCAVSAEITWPVRRFSLREDPLASKVTTMAAHPPTLHGVPLAVDLARHFVVGILGRRQDVWEFARGLIVQVCALYSYHEVKVALVTNEEERDEWAFLTSVGHFYAGEGERRLVALDYAGMMELDQFMAHELAGRSETSAEVLGDLGTYYVVVCANIGLAERSETIRRLLAQRQNLGFSLVYLGQDLCDLPRECGYLIELGNPGQVLAPGDDDSEASGARMFERADVSGTMIRFEPDIQVGAARARTFALDLARARLGVPGHGASMPETVGFLEMFEVGNVAHLNVARRWADNDASRSLQARVGIGSQGDVAYLDLHESIHGPHGLIAGTTGSGKSEFIITCVLSLCVSYGPDEVAFVLIDYKGGGLAGAFENERHHLPHLAGTITNLDGGSIHRALVSIKSELKRRQRLFNEAREVTGESTMDIHRYLSFYRQGMLAEPLPHLVIIADEFAELKQQEPDFMDELVSAARIGRSLGVHLVLATQKPSGVVDDQIWSNARFKVSLKVSDAADSREMIRRDDAAELDRPGRFYLLVGYNESFSMGQAAYAGGPYVPTQQFEPRKDLVVDLLDAQGQIVASQRSVTRAQRAGVSELDAVLGCVEEASDAVGRRARRLWLDPLPTNLLLDDLIDRYGDVSQAGCVCVVGELDDPEHQCRRRFEVDLAKVGNVMLFGSATSGVDRLAMTMVASMARARSADELWVYSIDLGAGDLGCLEALPHTGGIVREGEDERAKNLMRLLEAELVHRRQRMAADGRGTVPRIVVALANLAAFNERFEALEERLVALTRDAPRYGIHFLVTAAAAGTPRMRLKSSFGLFVPTVLNDASEYSVLVGALGGMAIPHDERRGIVRMGTGLFEFQGARLAETPEAEYQRVSEMGSRATSRSAARARAIPMLPAHVWPKDMGVLETLRIPVGYAKRSIAPVFFDLDRLRYMLVLGNDIESIASYLCAVRQSGVGGDAIRFVDPQRVLGEVDDHRVLRDGDRIRAFVHALDEGREQARVIVFTSIVQTISSLPAPESELLKGYLATERDADGKAFVVASELWRTKSIYDDWHRVVFAYGNGVWIGEGFSDQTVFGFSRSLPEYRSSTRRCDGFLTVRGRVDAVRLIECSPRDVEEEVMPEKEHCDTGLI